MREIKFRAWVVDRLGKNAEGKQDGGYFKEGVFTLEDIAANIDDIGENLLCKREMKFMQFTGLKDKNGKEIYEGDIVKENLSRGEPIISTVEYVGSGFSPFCDDMCTADFHVVSTEVIGNIYENPELLEKSK